jgi:hypothetical protein
VLRVTGAARRAPRELTISKLLSTARAHGDSPQGAEHQRSKYHEPRFAGTFSLDWLRRS